MKKPNKQNSLVMPRVFGERPVYPVPQGEPFQIGERVQWKGAAEAKYTDGEMFGAYGTVVSGRKLNIGWGYNTDRVIEVERGDKKVLIHAKQEELTYA